MRPAVPLDPAVEEIIRHAEAAFDAPTGIVLARRREVRDCNPRFAAIYLARLRMSHSSGQLGRQFRRDHTTILYAVTRARELIEVCPEFKAGWERLLRSCPIRQ